MFYTYNPHRHVKIWLSKNPDSFLNLENQLRLIRMRSINPTDEINFVYDSSLLSAEAIEELDKFCLQYNIAAKDVQKDLLPQCKTVEENNLIKAYKDEIAHLDEGGNLAVACDILRWLRPVYELGTYTDFDVPVDTREIPPTVQVDKPLLVNMGSVVLGSGIESLALNNDTVAVVDCDAALEDIKKIQKTLFENSLAKPYSSVFQTHISTNIRSLEEFLPPFIVPILLKMDPNYAMLDELASISRGKTSRQVRHNIMKLTENNKVFSENILAGSFIFGFGYLSDQEKITAAAAQLRSTVQSQLGWFNWLFLPSAQYQQIKAIASIKDDNEFLTTMRKQTRMGMLKTNVIYTSGPGAVALGWLGRLFLKRETIDTDIALSSFAHYGLDKVFISENSLPMHAKSKEVVAKMSVTEVGKTNDLSWLEEGQNATVVREQKIEKSALTIQRFFRGNKVRAEAHLPASFLGMRDKTQAHIDKIEADLNGWFGFYRYRQRHEKIRALRGILTHFDKEHFDVDGFQKALASYRSTDISASLGKSETKALIDELTLFSHRAKIYRLTDSQGQLSLNLQ
ncbi:putative glucosyltransferase Lgt1 [Legionella donaldsonii]|uniref:Putative glucosyltransferase Lgt1 n=1 Tax=Legionella donaldsonii TaxID=45060 RepID=A0A378J287_9GAMM|nr:glycosyltransferase family 88 protein [Legionella donaldsonii]STX41863.1 putative glucosyltransferase Lgt1 [Legionella donaldsonii]